MSFAVAWNMAIAFIEKRARDFRQMWMDSIHEDRIDMPELQRRLQKAVEQVAESRIEAILREILQDTLSLQASPESDERAFLQGVAAAEEVIEAKLMELGVGKDKP